MDEEAQDRQLGAAVAALIGTSPKDEVEAMTGGQLVACAVMAYYRRCITPQPPRAVEGWQQNLNQANKLSRTYALLLDALNRHRGKEKKDPALLTGLNTVMSRAGRV